MNVLIMGAGAIGSVVGGFLASAGHKVTLVGRAEHMEAVASKDLQITGIWGEHHVANLRTETSAEAIEPAHELVLITVKSYDTSPAICRLAPYIAPDALVCAYQNGLGNAELIAEVVGWHRTIGARAIFGANLREPGWVDVTVIAQPTALGVYDSKTDAKRVQDIALTMDMAGVPTVFTDNIERVLWAKVAYNCALNPLSAMLNVPYGALVKSEGTMHIMREVIGELYAVAKAMNVALEPATAGAYLDHFVNVLLPPTAAHYASMHADLAHGRRTEIDALNGAIWKYGREHGVPCPANAFLTNLIHAREQLSGHGAE